MSNKEIFDWSKVERNTLISIIWNLKDQLSRKKLTVFEFHRLISQTLKSVLPIKVRKFYTKEIPKGIIYIGGSYFSDLDETKKIPICLDFFYNKKKDTYILDTRRIKSICTSIADTILHEIIHMRQYRRRNFKFLPDYASTADKTDKRQEQSYLGNSDEIDAYSFNIACELLDKFNGNQKKIVTYLDQNQKYKKRKFNGWRMYLLAFDHDHNHKIIKRVKKKVIKYLPHAVEGKPYRNKDWIGH
jgi:hypothetical protein